MEDSGDDEAVKKKETGYGSSCSQAWTACEEALLNLTFTVGQVIMPAKPDIYDLYAVFVICDNQSNFLLNVSMRKY